VRGETFFQKSFPPQKALVLQLDQMKILFTTPFRDSANHYDWFADHSPEPFRLLGFMPYSLGLRAIKANIPQIEIMEFPLLEEYRQKLAQGWDVVGFSFYTYQTDKIALMADMARKAGAGALWGGNYGALHPAAAGLFDRVFEGYSEEAIASELGLKLPRIVHPVLYYRLGIKPLPFQVQLLGVIQTSRGCLRHCSFCQTPAFAPQQTVIPIESLDEILAWHRAHGVNWIMVMDENFGVIKSHSEAFLELVEKHGLYWSVMTRADIALKNLDTWLQTRLMGIGVGIESLDQRALDAWDKQQSTETIRQLISRLSHAKRYLWGYYVFGHEWATYESTLAEIEDLYKLGVGIVQFGIITPFVRTPLYADLKNRFGIDESDWSRFDLKHLVWKHPNISPDQMQKLRRYACERHNNPLRFSSFLWQIFNTYTHINRSRIKAATLSASFPVKAFIHRKTAKKPPFAP
jgi:radical SAM superfamily enzyme YgiQ (UPF0313 family)